MLLHYYITNLHRLRLHNQDSMILFKIISKYTNELTYDNMRLYIQPFFLDTVEHVLDQELIDVRL